MDADDDNERNRSYCNSTLSELDRNSLISAESLTESRDDPQDDDSHGHGTNTSATQAAKALDIAEGNNTWDPSTPSRPASLATSSGDLYAADERQALVDAAGPPPPDYAQATARQETAPSGSVDEESLRPAREAISLADLSQHTGKPHHWKGSVNRGWKFICLLSLVIYCIIATIIFILRSASYRRVTTKLHLHPPDHPASNIDQPQNFHKRTTQCHFDSYTGFDHFGWVDPESFSLIDTVQESDYEDFGNVSISGHVEIRPAPYGQSDAIVVITNFAKTSTWRAGIPKRDLCSDKLRIYHSPSDASTPLKTEHSDLRRSTATGGACLDIWVGIYVQTQLDNFTLHTETMHVDIGASPSYQKGLWSFRIRNKSRIYSKRGDITASNWDGRIAHVTSERGSITGKYRLNDHLSLETKSGDISVDIWHESAAEQKYLSSHPPNTPANLSTVTSSGDQNLRISQGTITLDMARIRGLGYPYLLDSSHYSGTGSINVQTGSMWEGKVHATSVNGSINLRGNKLELLPNPMDGIPIGEHPKHVWAKKGNFDGAMTIETTNGNISLCADTMCFLAAGHMLGS